MMKENTIKPKFCSNVLFIIGIFYISSAPIAFIWISGEVAEKAAIYLLVAGALLVVLSRFNEVSQLELFGLRAKLERALTEAYATLDQLKELAKLSSLSSLSNTARSGWLGGIPDDLEQEILTSTQAILKKLGCTAEEIEQVCKDFHYCILTEYKLCLLGKDLRMDGTSECWKEWQALRRWNEGDLIPPDTIKAFLEKYKFLDDARKKRLDGYEHYYLHHQFLNFDDFKARYQWPDLKSEA